MAKTDPANEGERQLRAELAALAGVENALVDDATGDIWLILRPDGESHHIEPKAREIAGTRTVHVAVRPERRDRQRVRFVEIRRRDLADQQAEISVVLEWAGREYTGTATGDSRGPLELRTAALASLDAVGAIVPGEIQLRLAGVKQVRAFDEDLIIVSLYRPGAEPRNLVGVVVTGSEPRRSAAVAVLNALNRLLGNYLQQY